MNKETKLLPIVVSLIIAAVVGNILYDKGYCYEQNARIIEKGGTPQSCHTVPKKNNK